MNRRNFTNRLAMASWGIPLVINTEARDWVNTNRSASDKVPLGVDVHSVRGMKWNAKQLIDYVIDLDVDSILLNELHYFESFDEAYLKSLKKLLDQHDMSIYFGIGGLSVNSPSYSDKFGPPKELIQRGIRMAKIFGSPSVNCKIGSHRDRHTEGGIEARMEEIINELSVMRSEIQDAGIKFAVENHAGDMRSEEVLQIVEAVGPDICGVMLDPGNAVWVMEDPMYQIEKLGKHVLCTSIRDYRIWETENGAALSWTAIGEGAMDFVKYTERMSELCPEVPLQIETISNLNLKIPYLTDEYWEGFPDLKAYQLQEFFAMLHSKESKEVPVDSALKESAKAEQEHQKQELMKSISYLRENCPIIH